MSHDVENIPEWDGTGVPPVGTVCEFVLDEGDEDGDEVEVVAIRSGKVVVYFIEQEDVLLVPAFQVRPARPGRASEKVREEFEQWAVSDAWLGLGVGGMERYEDGYRHSEVQASWIGWQASRACLEVVMPSPQRDDGVKGDGYNMALSDCRAAIEAAGAKVSIGSVCND